MKPELFCDLEAPFLPMDQKQMKLEPWRGVTNCSQNIKTTYVNLKYTKKLY